MGQSQASDEYLSSEVESRPGDPEAYLKLGRYYQQAGQAERALTELRHVLELDTKRADVHSEIALVLWDAGRQNEALTEWKTGLGTFERQLDPTTGMVSAGWPPTFAVTVPDDAPTGYYLVKLSTAQAQTYAPLIVREAEAGARAGRHRLLRNAIAALANSKPMTTDAKRLLLRAQNDSRLEVRKQAELALGSIG